jgi:hypothetical protein
LNLPSTKSPNLTLDAIDAGVHLVAEKTRPDAKDYIERQELELEAVTLRNKLARSYLKNVKADRKMRRQYAGRILRYLEWYSGGVAILLLLSGFGVLGFHLEQGVMATLVGSTAIAAIGLVGFIARGLFNVSPLKPHIFDKDKQREL